MSAVFLICNFIPFLIAASYLAWALMEPDPVQQRNKLLIAIAATCVFILCAMSPAHARVAPSVTIRLIVPEDAEVTTDNGPLTTDNEPLGEK
ncbi:MAG: hypothetical protein ABSA30_00125 [Candidatus Aminicenantales bacterium]